MSDVYQQRYLAHQARKKEQLSTGVGENPTQVIDPVRHRRSQRLFNSEPVSQEDCRAILEAATYAPNSCNRHGIQLRVVYDRADKALASGMMVGGVGWAHRAHMLVLFFADPLAYKSPNEKQFMHYCDVGFTAMNMWLTAEQLGIGACYINPNIAPHHKPIMQERFGKGIFCGALAIGNYDVRVKESEHPTLEDIVLK